MRRKIISYFFYSYSFSIFMVY